MTDDARDTRLDWALREALGAEAPPDLARVTVARFRAGDAARVPSAAVPRHTHWQAVAALLLACLVVATFALWPRPAEPATPAQEPEPVQVYSRADIDALPATTLAVSAVGLDDSALSALLRLRELRFLEIRYPEAMVLGLGLKTMPPKQPPCITATCFDTLAKLSKLRTLRIRGAHAITEAFPFGGSGGGPEAIANATIGHLERLPLLEELCLTHFDVPAYALAALSRLAALRRLDLSANYGVDAEVVVALLRCTRLQSLTLDACMALPGTAIARLAELPHLEHLAVANIDGMSWRSGGGDFLGPTTKDYEAQAHRAYDLGGCGVTDAALTGLSRAKSLRTLLMAERSCSLLGVRALRDFQSLERLDLFGFGSSTTETDVLADSLPPLLMLSACGEFDDSFCNKLRRRQPRLEHLELPACYAITDQGLAQLLRIGTLRHLDIRQSRGLSAAAMPLLLAATQLEYLDLRHIDWVTKAHVLELQRALPRLRTLLANVEGHETEPSGR